MDIYRFYVYAYLREDGTPYYIGKGSSKRWIHGKNDHFKTPKDRSRIVFLETELSELGAFALERRMIWWYGRKDIGTGILRNRTDGGEGMAGAIFSEQHKKKIGNFHRGKLKTESHKNALRQARSKQVRKPCSEETKAKISAAKKGKPQASVASKIGKKRSPEFCEQRRLNQTGKRRTAESIARGLKTKAANRLLND